MEQIEKIRPMVHAITNHVSANDVANAILAVGGLPIMAEYQGEVEEITVSASALVLNMGLLHPNKYLAMRNSGKIANKNNIPVILDPVGCMSSRYRKSSLRSLLSEIQFSVIRGNFAEMKTLSEIEYYEIWTKDYEITREKVIKPKGNFDEHKNLIAKEREKYRKMMEESIGKGVDSYENGDCLEEKIAIAKNIAQKYRCIAIITGENDIVTDGKKTFCLQNGSPRMAKITGAGCMLSGLLGAFVGARQGSVLDSAVLACQLFSVAGELADEKATEKNLGTASMRNFLIDYLSLLDEDSVLSRAKFFEIK